MAKEWILNSATNNFQLNYKRNVGATSESIRKCAPKTIEEWKNYYFENVKTEQHLIDIGKKLYIKITEVIQAEVSQITEEDCINYIFNLVIRRTYDGYIREIKTIYGELEGKLKIKINPASDEWDRLYNVDFFIEINNKYIGLQIKPITQYETQIVQVFKEKKIQVETHKKFKKKFGGNVFYIFSGKQNGKKIIHNKEVIAEIRNEIQRIKNL